MIRLLPRTPRGTWLLAGAVWLAGCGALWWALPYCPRVAWPTETPAVVHGLIPGTRVFLTSSAWNYGLGGPPHPTLGPLVARDAASGEVREWLSAGKWLTQVDPGTDGRHVLIGRMLGGRARLFLHDANSGAVVAELPRGGRTADNDQPLDDYEQFASFHPAGRQVVYNDRVGVRRWLRVWDVDTSQEVAALPDAVPPAAWSPDGRTLAYAIHNRALDVWSLELWDANANETRPFNSLLPLNEAVWQMAFSPDGQTLVAVTGNKWNGMLAHVVGWELATGSEKYHHDPFRAAMLGGLPWFATLDLTSRGSIVVRRYDYATGKHCGDLGAEDALGHSWYGFSPDGLLAVGSRRHTNPILDLLNKHFPATVPRPPVSEQPLLVQTEADRALYSLPMVFDRQFRSPSPCHWSGDGSFLVIAGENTLAVWDIPPRKSLAWLAAGAGLLACPFVIQARRRCRRELAVFRRG
jgi:hypothetical protein